MTSKAKLMSTIVAALFIAVMIPVAIFASANQSVSISNQVQFYVEDLEGKFYYAITGNKPDKDGASADVGYNPYTGIILPQLLFMAEYSDTNDDYFVYNGTGGIVADQSIPVPQTHPIEMDVNHQEISYYFVFINEAQSTDVNSRSVFITAQDEHSIDPTLVSTGWSYIIKNAGGADALSPLQTNGIWTHEDDKPEIFDTGIEVKPKDRALCTYIILKYTLKLLNENAGEFSNDLNLTVTLKSAET